MATAKGEDGGPARKNPARPSEGAGHKPGEESPQKFLITDTPCNLGEVGFYKYEADICMYIRIYMLLCQYIHIYILTSSTP